MNHGEMRCDVMRWWEFDSIPSILRRLLLLSQPHMSLSNGVSHKAFMVGWNQKLVQSACTQIWLIVTVFNYYYFKPKPSSPHHNCYLKIKIHATHPSAWSASIDRSIPLLFHFQKKRKKKTQTIGIYNFSSSTGRL